MATYVVKEPATVLSGKISGGEARQVFIPSPDYFSNSTYPYPLQVLEEIPEARIKLPLKRIAERSKLNSSPVLNSIFHRRFVMHGPI